MKRREEEVPLRVFVGGGQEFYGPTSDRDRKITKKVPEILHRFAPEVQIVTGGMQGIADIFSCEWSKLGGRCLDVVSSEYVQDYARRDTKREFMVTGESQLKRRLAVTSLEGIKCAIFIQGGKYSTHEIKLFLERGIPVVTLYGGGGAAGGQCPYEDWTYEAPKHVLNSIVSSTDPEESAYVMANVLTGSVLHEISQPLRDIREGLEEDPKKQKMAEDLKKSTAGVEDMDIEEEELGGLLCVPPGMSAEEVHSFNKMFLSKDRREQSAMIEQMAKAARASGATIINLRVGEDGKLDEESVKAGVEQIAAQLKSREGEKTKDPKCPNCLVDPGVVDGKCKYGCGWTVEEKGKEEEPTKYAVVFDIESRGDNEIENGIVSIGYVIGRTDCVEVLEKGRIDLAPLWYVEYSALLLMKEEIESCIGRGRVPTEAWTQDAFKQQDFEERCLKEFWQNEEKFPGIGEKLKQMTANPMDPIEGITKFRSIIDAWDDREKGRQAVIISDNVQFDCRFINHYLATAGLPSLAYDKTKTWYRPNFDIDNYARGLERMDYSNIWTSDTKMIEKYGLQANKEDHTHMPEDDAEFIYRMHMELVLKVSKSRTAE